MAKISIFGLGYVGAVSTACFSNDGHTVIGVDTNQEKVKLIANGKSPIVENDLGKLLQNNVKAGRISATSKVETAIWNSEISFICVGTPSQLNGSLDLKYVRRVCEEIGAALKNVQHFHVVVCRSTILPGTMKNVVIPTLEQYSEKTAGKNFGVCNNPEFLREGTAVYDFYHPPKKVIGQTDQRSGDMVAGLYEKMAAPIIRTDIETAEMVKYADNVWHATKVCFANEIGNICKALNIDSHKVMEIFCQDTKLNLSSYYMKPGFAFGGSCLPKDVRALTFKGKSLDLNLPVLNALLASNQQQVENAYKMIIQPGNRNIGILGFSFKAGTDDLRESPMVDIIERLIGKGYNIKIYDKNVSIAKLVGANKDYLLNHIPHISNLMVDDMNEVLTHSETIVIGNSSEEFNNLFDRIRPGQIVVDMVRITKHPTTQGKYHGLCW